MEKLEEINKQIEGLRSQQSRLEAENFQNRIKPVVLASIGNTFVYRRNSSGDGYYDTFRKLLGVEFTEYHGWLIFEKCAVPANGMAKIEIETSLLRRSDSFPEREMGWVRCEVSEYDATRQAVMEQFANPTKRAEYLKQRY